MRDSLGSVQSVLVLGGGSDIALATLRRLAAGRTRTAVLAARHPERLAETAEDLRRRGMSKVDLVAFDADSLKTHRQVIEDVFTRHGDVDTVIVAAGVLPDQDRLDADPEAATAVLRTNFLGAASATLIAAQCLARQGHGTLIVLSSVAGERARKSNYVYGASKAGLDALAQGLGDRLEGSGVRVLVVRPGFVRTKMTRGLPPAPLAVGPDDVANAIVEGLRRGAHTVWVPGELRWVMAGLRHLPRPVFRLLPL